MTMKVWNWSRKSIGAALLAIVLIVLAGCQAVGGLDFNTMLKNTLKVISYEGSETIEIKLTPSVQDSDTALDEETAKLLELFTHFKLQLDNVKIADEQTMSMDGSLDFSGKRIGFSLKMDEKLMAVEIEGASKPFLFDLEEVSEDGEADEEASGGDSLLEAGNQMAELVGGFAIDNLPNPTNLTVAPAQESVGGETVSGFKVHAELNGNEMWSWIKSYIDALTSDEEGLREMLGGLMDLLYSQSELAEAVGGESIFGSISESDMKADEIDEAVDYYLTMLTEYKDELEAMEKDSPDMLQTLFNDETYVKADLLVDSKLDIRKSAVEFNLQPKLNEDDEFGFDQIWVKMTREQWNVNGKVTPETPAAIAGAVAFEDLFEMEGYQLLSHFSKESDAYDLLRNDLHIAKQAVYTDGILTPGGVTIVPLRDTANYLGATLTKDAATGTIKVYDEATNTTIRLKTGSKEVTVNGKKQTWAFPATVVGGVTYVAGKDFAKALGGTAKWEVYADEIKIFIIEREL